MNTVMMGDHQVAEAEYRAEQLRQVTEWISGDLALQPLLTRIVDSAVALLGAHYGSIGDSVCCRMGCLLNVQRVEAL